MKKGAGSKPPPWRDGPEPVAGATEVVADRSGVEAGIDAGEEHNEVFGGEIRHAFVARGQELGFGGLPGDGQCPIHRSPGSVVEEHHVLLDGLAADVRLIGGEVWVGVADRQAAQDRHFRRDRELRADDLGIPRDRDLDASPQASCGQGQQQRLEVDIPTPQGVCQAELPVHTDDAGQRRVRKSPSCA